MIITNKEVDAIKFFIKVADNYLLKHREEKKTKEKMIFFHEVLGSKLVLERMLLELGIKL